MNIFAHSPIVATSCGEYNPQRFKEDGKAKERRWTFRGVIECLAQLTCNNVSVNGAQFYQNSTPTAEQERILELLGVTV